MDENEGFFIGLFTLALFFATYFLHRSTEKLWAAGERQLVISSVFAEAAKQSADAAMLAVGSERAWMCYEGINHNQHTNLILNGLNIGDAIAVQVKWKNKGRSPALKCDIYFKAIGISFNETQCPQFVPVWNRHMSSAIYAMELPAISDQYFIYGIARDSFNRYEIAFAVYSAVRYFDIFGKEQRISEVCVKFYYIGQRKESDGVFRPFYGVVPFGPQNTVS